ncbi:MAG: hypothetical protein V4593_08155 [Pseudomonadota bacterium]
MIQIAVYPIDSECQPLVTPELGVHVVVADRAAGRVRADEIARAMGWLDRGVIEVCDVGPKGQG